MRARMRSPRCIRSRCSAVYAGDDFLGEPGMRVGVLFLSAFLIPILPVQVLAGWQAALSVHAYGFLVFSDQSVGLENRALSLGRDFMDETVMEFP